MAESVDAADSKSAAERCASSSLARGTSNDRSAFPAESRFCFPREPLPMSLTVDDFDFPLPPELIAQHPAPERSGSRLLHVRGQRLVDRSLPTCRLLNGRRPAGLQRHQGHQGALFRAKGKWRPGRGDARTHRRRHPRRRPDPRQQVAEAGRIVLKRFCLRRRYRPRRGQRRILRPGTGRGRATSGTGRAATAALPLPPYITHAAGEPTKRATRRSMPASRAPSPRRPPACISTRRCWHAAAQGVDTAWLTLHVGAGTFQPVRVEKIAEHRMHSERFEIPQATADAIAATRARGGRVIAVGTTSLRALESAAQMARCAPARPRPTSSSRRLPLPGRRPADHQLPPAEIDAADARLGLRRLWTIPSAPPTPTRSPSATASSATAMPCSSNRPSDAV
jgi:S-adenosylmethionine:tRNA ribosyltransferase-isomerase